MSDRRMTERRTEEDEDDRRKIPRFTDNELNRSLKLTHTWLRILYSFAIAVSIGEVAWSLTKGLENITQGMFFGTVFIGLAIIIWRTLYLIKTFLENHSISNLKRVHEQFQLLFAYITVLSLIFYIVAFMHRV